jgi:regulatory protein
MFDDGTEPRVTSAAALKELGIEEGTSAESAVVDAALAEVEAPLARDKAYQLLAHRDRSSVELSNKLIEAGYPCETVSAVVDRLVELGIVDDERFAMAWARSGVTRGLGPVRIRAELRLKGISDTVIGRALGELGDPSAQLEVAIRALRERTPKDRKDAARLVRRLVSRGFPYEIAVKAVGPFPQPRAVPLDIDPDLDDFPS